MFDHEYTLVAHPRLRAKVSYRRDRDDVTAATVRLDYRRDDEWTEEGTAVELVERPGESGVEWQGYRLALYRDSERVMAREVSSGLLSDALSMVDAVERRAPSIARKGKETASTLAGRVSRTGPVEMTQSDDSTVEALRPPAKATFEVYQSRDEKWRWRLVHDNGNVVADSGQGYSSRQAAEKGLRSVKRNALGAPIERVGGETERDVRAGSESDAGETDDGEPAES